jgi:osmotically inducible protein OsmC
MAAERTATSVWQGGLAQGSGKVALKSGAVAEELPVTWASRTERSEGKTSPEELIAAAHAACFSMALSHGLAQAGTPPDRLDVKATSTFVPGTGITAMKLDVTARVLGLDDEGFRAAAETAKENCPVSQALKGNVEITLDARLES